MSIRRQSLMSAALCVVIAALTLTYATFSWFTMSHTVSASGMNLKAVLTDNLEISLTNDEDSVWTNELDIDMTDLAKMYVSGYTSGEVRLLPGSTYAGFDDTVYKTDSADAYGAALTNTVFQTCGPVIMNGVKCEGYYFDIPLYFRTGDTHEDYNLYLEKTVSGVDGTYISSSSDNLEKIARVAFLSENDDGDLALNSMGGTTPIVLASNENGMAGKFVVTKPAYADNSQNPEYMLFSGSAGGPTYSNKQVVKVFRATESGSDLTYNVTKIVLRIWIEGQDANCIADVGDKTFNLGLKFTAR